jgi:hypothetical protein
VHTSGIRIVEWRVGSAIQSGQRHTHVVGSREDDHVIERRRLIEQDRQLNDVIAAVGARAAGVGHPDRTLVGRQRQFTLEDGGPCLAVVEIETLRRAAAHREDSVEVAGVIGGRSAESERIGRETRRTLNAGKHAGGRVKGSNHPRRPDEVLLPS